MPAYHCCVPGCTSSSRKISNPVKYPELRNIKFFSLPSKKCEIRRRKEWIRLIRREEKWIPNKYTRICSRHFVDECVDVLTPTLFPYNNYKQALKKRQTKTSTTAATTSLDVTEDDNVTSDHDTVTVIDETDHADIPYVVGEVECTDCTESKRSTGRIKLKSPHWPVQLPPSDLHHDHYCMKSENEESTYRTIGTQTDMSIKDVTKMEKKLCDTQSLLRDTFVATVTKNDKNVKLYTGLPSLAMLMGLFNILQSFSPNLKYWSGRKSAEEKAYQRGEGKKPGPKRKLSPFQEFILTLVRLRLGILGLVLADIFGVSTCRVSQVFTTWITLMSHVFSKLLKWPTREQVKLYMPRSFRMQYPKTRAIIDCTEFFFQRPRSPTAQSATYSTYKSRNTGKCLLAISPSGTFTFVSDVYGGNTSDRFITADSGFLDLVEEGDDIMADRGFTIRDLLTSKKATLNIPPFTRKCSWGKNKRLNLCEIRQTRRIAKLRIHVERAIQRLKLFKLLGNNIPWSLKPLTNQMVKVAAFFCNLMPRLVRR